MTEDIEYVSEAERIDYSGERPELDPQNTRVERRDETQPDYPVESYDTDFVSDEDYEEPEPVGVYLVQPPPTDITNVTSTMGSWTVTENRPVRIIPYEPNRKRAIIGTSRATTDEVFLGPKENTIADFGFRLGGADNLIWIEISGPMEVWATVPSGGGPARVSFLDEWFVHE